MTKPQLSVIVTCYNNAKYLPTCLDALLAQTLPDIEIICVDDASTDDSVKILQKYKKRDPRIRLILLDENQGVSIARNRALAAAKTKYIMFCDADDYYDPTMCEKMYQAITENHTDLAICGIEITYHAHPEMKISDDNYYSLKYQGLQLVNDELILKTDLAPTNKIFRRSLLEKYHLTFPAGLHFEDAYFCTAYLCISHTIFFVNERLYHYIRHQNSTMSQTWSDSETDFAIEHLQIAFRLYDFLAEHDLAESKNDLFWQIFYLYEFFALENSKSRERVKLVKSSAREFIAEHRAAFDRIHPNLHDDLLNRNSDRPYFSTLRLKGFLLRFMPTYRLIIENIHSLRTLHNKNQELITEIGRYNGEN